MFVGETIGLPRAIDDLPYEGMNSVRGRERRPLSPTTWELSLRASLSGRRDIVPYKGK